jgi:hypothetical protein
VLGGGFVMMAVAFYAAAVFPMMTIMRGRLVGGLCLGETRTILWRLLHSGSLLHRTDKRRSKRQQEESSETFHGNSPE